MTVAGTRTTAFLDWLDGWFRRLPEAALQEAVIDAAGGPGQVALMGVDLLIGFCCEGPLASPRVGALVPRITDLFSRAHAAGVRQFVLTQDSHPPDAPEFREFGPHCIAGTREAETVPELLALPVATSAVFLGKLSTAIQALYIFSALLLLAFDLDAPRLVEAAAWICALFTILSAAAYAGILLRGIFSGSRTA